MSRGVYIAYEQATGVPKDQVYLCLVCNLYLKLPEFTLFIDISYSRVEYYAKEQM